MRRDGRSGKKGARGILCSQATRREFLSAPPHRIRFVYLPKHSSWLNPIEILFGIVPRKILRGSSFDSVTALEEQLKDFITYYNTTMAHPFRGTDTGKPLHKPKRATFTPTHRRVKLQNPAKTNKLAI